MKHIKVIQEQIKKALGDDAAYQAGQENSGKKAVAAAIGAFLDQRANMYSEDETQGFVEKITEHAQNGHFRDAMDEFFNNYSAIEMKKDIEGLVLALTEEVPSYQVAIIVKKLPDMLPPETIGQIAREIADNVQIGIDDPAAMMQVAQFKAIGPMIAEQKATEIYGIINQMSVPEIAQIVKTQALNASTMIPDEPIDQIYDTMKEAAYESVASLEEGKYADNMKITQTIFTTLSKAFTDYASKDKSTSANAFGDEFKQNMMDIANKIQSQNAGAKKAANIVTGRKFKL